MAGNQKRPIIMNVCLQSTCPVKPDEPQLRPTAVFEEPLFRKKRDKSQF